MSAEDIARSNAKRPGHNPGAQVLAPRVELVLTGAILIASALMFVASAIDIIHAWPTIQWGADYRINQAGAARFLATGSPYQSYQLEGPYGWPGDHFIYPPTTMVVFVPFLFLPAILWWIVPLAVIPWALRRHRPRPLAWAVIAFCLANPTVHSTIAWGNPAMWLVMALALGTHWYWPSALIWFKPSVFPFALFGAWKRSWWWTFAAYIGLSLLFLPLWFEYLTVASNAQLPSGWFGYSTAQIPMFLTPLSAWIGRTR